MMVTTELDGMVRNEQYGDMIREAEDAAPPAEGRPRTTGSATKVILQLPVVLLSLATRWLNLGLHVACPLF